MRRALVIATSVVVVMALGLTLVSSLAYDAQAKPVQCILTVEPFVYCEQANRCRGEGEMLCWECLGVTPDGEPCLCSRLGCMVP